MYCFVYWLDVVVQVFGKVLVGQVEEGQQVVLFDYCNDLFLLCMGWVNVGWVVVVWVQQYYGVFGQVLQFVQYVVEIEVFGLGIVVGIMFGFEVCVFEDVDVVVLGWVWQLDGGLWEEVCDQVGIDF